MYFALKKYILEQFVHYTDALCKAVKDGRIQPKDMEGNIMKIPSEVKVYTIDAWTPRVYPAITLDVDSIRMELSGIDRGFAMEQRSENNPAEKVFVYLATVGLALACFGRTLEERDILSDLMLFFYTRKDVYDFLLSRRIRISTPANIRTYGEETPPGQDFKIYYAGLSLELNTECIIQEISNVPTIGDVIAEVEDPVKI